MARPSNKTQSRGNAAGMRLAVALSTLWFVRVAAGEAPQPESQTADQLVAAALRAEIEGSQQRGRLLQAALQQSPGHPAALWHSGHVRLEDRWFQVDQVPERTAENPQLAAYRRQRAKLLADRRVSPADAHRRLAQWCRNAGLRVQERAHLMSLLEQEPDNTEVRAKLGFVRVNGVWLSAQEVREAAVRAEQARQALAAWGPRLTEIRRGLEGNQRPPLPAPRGKRAAASKPGLSPDHAQQRWETIADPAAIPAMELVFSADRRPVWAEMVVEKLAGWKCQQATVSLARHAVFHTTVGVREKALEALKSRPYENYVPMLLSTLATPVHARTALFCTPSGQLLHQLTFYREGQEQKELAVFETAYRYVPTRRGDLQTAWGQAIDATRRQLGAAERAVSQENLLTQQLNDRIGWTLAQITGENLVNTPEQWWQWWNNYSEVFVAGEKPLHQVYQAREVGVTGDTPAPPTSGHSGHGHSGEGHSGGHANKKDCLAGGTPVWTDRGPVPIEEVLVGDQVLSQDPQTGELAYKPVLATTTRPAGPLVKIQLGGESLQASGGHRFWVSGKGWTKTRMIEPGNRLHGPTHTAEVSARADGDTKVTYNLVVADFHTYFVGKARVLSHDNTILQPTVALVPGLVPH